MSIVVKPLACSSMDELMYSPLSDTRGIRTLAVHPGRDAEPVRCSFGFTNIDSPIDYEAISYAWENSDRTHKITSLTGNSSLAVPASCYAALTAVRQEHIIRIVWIDSVCINQDDVLEKGAQVAMMGTVYAAAKRTLVYLGEDDGTFEDLIEALARVRQRQMMSAQPADITEEHPIVRAMRWLTEEDNTTIHYVVRMADLSTQESQFAEQGEAYWPQDDLPPLRDFHKSLFARTWFTRLWVIQEVALSRQVHVYLGRNVADWGTIMALYNLVDFMYHQSEQAYYGHPLVSDRSMLGTRICEKFKWTKDEDVSGFNFAPEYYALRHRTPALHDDDDDDYYAQAVDKVPIRLLSDLIYEMRTYGCKDERDRLFAILSIIDGPIPAQLRPNYDSSLTPEILFTRLSCHQIDSDRFEVLAHAHGLLQPRKGLPSWVSNWSSLPHRGTLLTPKTLHANISVGTAHGMPHMRSISHDAAMGVIVLRGMVFDEVTYVSLTCPSNATRDEFIRFYSCWIWTNKYVHSPELGSKIHHWLTSKQLPAHFFDYDDDYDGYLVHDPLQLTPDNNATKGNPKKGIEDFSRGRAFATVGSSGKDDPERIELYEEYLSSPYVPSDEEDDEGGYAASESEFYVSSDEDDWEGATQLDRNGGPYGIDETLQQPSAEELRKSRDQDQHESSSESEGELDQGKTARRMKWAPRKARCLVPDGTKEGDLVCGLVGYDLAVILRPTGKRYRFVGTTTCWKYSINRELPELDWGDVLSNVPQKGLRDFTIF